MSRNQIFPPVRPLALPFTDCRVCPVRSSSLFACVPEKQLPQLESYRESQLEVKAGQTLIYEGERPGYTYTLFSGWMALFQTLHSGKRQILRFSLPGDFIGLQVNGGGIASYAVQALSDVVVCAFKYPQLNAMLDAHGVVGKRLLAMQVRNMNLCQHHLMGAGRKTAEERVAFMLLELYHRARLQIPAQVSTHDGSIPFPLTQEDLADAVGLSKVHVNRVLRDLAKRGYIRCHQRRLAIIKEKQLAEIAEFHTSMVTTPQFV